MCSVVCINEEGVNVLTSRREGIDALAARRRALRHFCAPRLYARMAKYLRRKAGRVR